MMKNMFCNVVEIPMKRYEELLLVEERARLASNVLKKDLEKGEYVSQSTFNLLSDILLSGDKNV